MAYVMAAAVPAIPALVGLVFGIRKDGSPFKRSWWTS